MRTLLHAIAASLLAACGPAADAEERQPIELPVDPTDAEVVAVWNGGEVTRGEVEARIGQELRELEIRTQLARYDRVVRTVDQIVDEALLEAEAGARGFDTVEELIEAEVREKTPSPTAEEVAAVYPAMASQLGGASLELARPIIREELWERAREQRYREYVAQLRRAAGLEVRVPYPDMPRIPLELEGHDPSVGPADAPVTVVQFAEYTCTWCGAAGEAVEQLRERWPDQVRVVWKDFPLAGHARAVPAALAAHCAADQDRFWDMHARLLAHPEALEDRDLFAHAEAIGLDREPFEECLLSSRHIDGIYADLAAGREAGVRAAPTFFVNGLVVPGVQPWDRFADIVERELQRTASR